MYSNYHTEKRQRLKVDAFFIDGEAQLGLSADTNLRVLAPARLSDGIPLVRPLIRPPSRFARPRRILSVWRLAPRCLHMGSYSAIHVV